MRFKQQTLLVSLLLGAPVAVSVMLGCQATRSRSVLPETAVQPRAEALAPQAPVEQQIASIHRSTEAVEARIARKEARLARAKTEGGEFTGGQAALAYRRLQRLDDNGTIETGALYRAKLDLDSRFEARDGGIWNWEWLGPGNVGGRTRAICFTSATIAYLGGSCGGIWKSTDSAATWTPLTDFLPSMSVTSIVADTNNANQLWAATGESNGSSAAIPGAGVFRTTNGGISWNQLPDTANWSDTMRLAIVPGTQTLFAATEQGVFRSTNDGDDWTEVLNTANARDVRVDPGNTQRILVGTATAVFLSTTGGGVGSFTQQTTGGNMLPTTTGRCEVTFGANGNMWVSMNRNQGEIWRSTNAGSTWTQRNTGTNYLATQGNYDNAIWASPDDANLVVVGGINLWRSTDGGTNLTQISQWQNYLRNPFSAHADQHAIVAAPGYNAGNRRVYFGNDGGIQTCSNIYNVALTSGWSNLAGNLGITQFYAGAAHPSGSHILGGTQDNSTLRYRPGDGTDGWWLPFTGDGGSCAIDPTNANNQYASWQNLNFMKSTNGGQSFSGATNGLTEAGNGPFVTPFEMDPFNPSVIVAGATNVWRTTDAAANWGSIRGAISGNICNNGDAAPMVSRVAFAPNLQNRIWVGYCTGRVSRTTSNVSTWTDVDDDIPNRFVTDIAVNPNNANEVFVTIGGYLDDTVWFSDNQGASWELRHGTGATALPAVQVNTITFHPQNPNWVYVGTDLGTFCSENKGLTWNQTPRFSGAGHEGPTSAEVDDLFWQGNSLLIAATHGRGMWRVLPRIVVYVDKSNNGAEDGTLANPFNTVQEGISAAGHGTRISIEAGDYDETFTTRFNKRGRVVATNGVVRIR